VLAALGVLAALAALTGRDDRAAVSG